MNAAEATSSIQFMSTLELKVTRSPRTSGDAAGLGTLVLWAAQSVDAYHSFLIVL